MKQREKTYRSSRAIAALSMAVAALGFCTPATSADWAPSKPVRMIVGFPPGGATDLVARQIAPRMSQGLGRQVVVENRPGANGVISNELIMRAEPDGHTIGFGHIGTLVISPVITKVPYNVQKDLAPIGLIVSLQNIIVVTPSLPASNLKEYLALARRKPGDMLYASSGSGSPGHLAAVLLESMTGVQMTHVPYKGSSPALTDLIGGQVQLMFDNLPSSLSFIKAGKLRALAVTSSERSATLPELPTLAESGLPGFEASSWFGVLAPAGTPKEIVDKINATVIKGFKNPEVRKRLDRDAIDPEPLTPAQFTEFVKEETYRWGPIAKALAGKSN